MELIAAMQILVKKWIFIISLPLEIYSLKFLGKLILNIGAKRRRLFHK